MTIAVKWYVITPISDTVCIFEENWNLNNSLFQQPLNIRTNSIYNNNCIIIIIIHIHVYYILHRDRKKITTLKTRFYCGTIFYSKKIFQKHLYRPHAVERVMICGREEVPQNSNLMRPDDTSTCCHNIITTIQLRFHPCLWIYCPTFPQIFTMFKKHTAIGWLPLTPVKF